MRLLSGLIDAYSCARLLTIFRQYSATNGPSVLILNTFKKSQNLVPERVWEFESPRGAPIPAVKAQNAVPFALSGCLCDY
jgi:hypothetical protein